MCNKFFGRGEAPFQRVIHHLQRLRPCSSNKILNLSLVEDIVSNLGLVTNRTEILHYFLHSFQELPGYLLL